MFLVASGNSTLRENCHRNSWCAHETMVITSIAWGQKRTIISRREAGMSMFRIAHLLHIEMNLIMTLGRWWMGFGVGPSGNFRLISVNCQCTRIIQNIIQGWQTTQWQAASWNRWTRNSFFWMTGFTIELFLIGGSNCTDATDPFTTGLSHLLRAFQRHIVQRQLAQPRVWCFFFVSLEVCLRITFYPLAISHNYRKSPLW